MSIFSVNKGAKSRALQYEALATDVQGQQRDVDFGRVLLSNIRQERLARAQLRASSYSDDTVSSSGMGAVANIDSALAGEMGYSYETSERAEKIQTYQQKAQAEWKKYQKSIQKAGMAGQIMGTAGAVIGSIIPGVGTMAGAAIGAAIGTGLTAAMGGGHVATGAAARSGITGTVTAGIAEATAGLQASQMAAKGLTYAGETTASGIKSALTSEWGWRLGTAFDVSKSSWQAGGYGQQQTRGIW